MLFPPPWKISADFMTPGGLPLQPLCEIKLLELARLQPATENKIAHRPGNGLLKPGLSSDSFKPMVAPASP